MVVIFSPNLPMEASKLYKGGKKIFTNPPAYAGGWKARSVHSREARVTKPPPASGQRLHRCPLSLLLYSPFCAAQSQSF